ncbi:hypothetical protein LCGC14_0929770 [marine sediment metagenome]|uniref:Uncharacterized protein n=1 Tax=marine sediment metagenome TaxID=412755 RepID=A0A0F9R6T1_9ZZZZ
MAEIKITIPNDRVQLVLDAFASERGIAKTPAALKGELTDEIKSVVKRYKLGRLEKGQDAMVTVEDMEVGLT